jgi:hypothetical protein
VYNVMGEWCSWGCVDIDTDDRPLAERIRNVLVARSIPAWIERTTRGYHVWVFPRGQGEMTGRVEARLMRRALRAACLAVGYVPKEVFPKQDQASGAVVGNYVRLPLNGSHHDPPPPDVRRFVHPVSLEEMDDHRAEVNDLYDLAAMCPPDPQPVDISVDMQAGLEVEDEVWRYGNRAARLWRDGPRQGRDRSNTLTWLAYELAEHDADPSVALAIVASADKRWGKFADRPDGMTHLHKIIERAYGSR